MSSWSDFEGYQGTVRFPVKGHQGKTVLRTYPFYSSHRGGARVAIRDTTAPFMAFLVRTFPSEFNRALGSAGWWLQQEIKNTVYDEDPPGENWPELSEIQQQRVLDDAKGHFRQPATHAYGQLVKAVGYRRDKRLMRVRVGWLSPAAARRAWSLQRGFSTRVTDKMRRFFGAAGLPIPAEDTIESPPRDLITPVYEGSRDEVFERIEQKISYYLGKSSRAFALR
ncbi:hypothetical protein [Desulfovibrio oxyclinae]|uniref:hypothetical protein n=1 Tax=Desulfovibrio oxyclinae TaxID=63560 RepID=UPI000382C160|nr:hypothetical protein [Desulfovibrio oxyclinae]